MRYSKKITAKILERLVIFLLMTLKIDKFLASVLTFGFVNIDFYRALKMKIKVLHVNYDKFLLIKQNFISEILMLLLNKYSYLNTQVNRNDFN